MHCPFARRISLLGSLVALALLSPAAHAAVSCAELATNPAHGLAGNPVVKTVMSAIIPAGAPNASYCQVNILYGTSPEQNINIRVGLPLNALDGGAGGLQGAWNGRTQGIGGGGCSSARIRSSALS